MDLYDLVVKRRSIRRFRQRRIPFSLLQKCVEAARVAPSAANLQPLEFIIVEDPDICDRMFTTLAWAGYLKPVWKPDVGERPTAYIIILGDRNKSKWIERDASFAAANIIYAAEAERIGCCVLLKIKRDELKRIHNVPSQYDIDSVVALGYKAEHPVVTVFSGSVKYYRDGDDVLHVPKRSLSDILHKNIF